jgi:hypothetical protein
MSVSVLAKSMGVAFAFIVVVIAASGAAMALEKPTGKPILTISGNISVTNDGDSAVFDREMLESMGMVEFTTTTPWYDGPVEFEGVPMRKLLEVIGAEASSEITAIALNDYKATIPAEDFNKFEVILALKRDGEYMPIRDKGPLFIVYPYDSESELATQKYYSRSVWQISQLAVR